MTQILGISASQRESSHSRLVLEQALREAESFGARTQMIDLRSQPLPLLRPGAEAEAEHYAAIRQAVIEADALILATPDYHGGISGTMKNFLDTFWHEFTGKLFGTLVASHEKGLTVQDQMRTAVRQCYGWSLPYGIGFNGDAEVDRQTGVLSETLNGRVRMMARDLTVYGALLTGQFRADLACQPRQPGFAARFMPTWPAGDGPAQ